MTAVICPQCGANVHVDDGLCQATARCDFCETAIERSPPRDGWIGWPLADIWVAVVLIGTLALAAFLLFVGLNSSAYEPPAYFCKNNLSQIGKSMLAHDAVHGSLPPAFAVDAQGHRLYSWRYFVLPYLDNAILQRQFDPKTAWDSPNNSRWSKTNLDTFTCGHIHAHIPGTTPYVVIVDPDGAFTGSTPVALQDVTDRLDQTLAAIELEHAIPWSAPRDPTLAEVLLWLRQKPAFDRHQQMVNVVFLDGHVDAISLDELTPQLLRALVTRAGGEKIEKVGQSWRIAP